MAPNDEPTKVLGDAPAAVTSVDESPEVDTSIFAEKTAVPEDKH